MDIIEAMRRRMSVRGYKKDQVPREVLEGIIEIARRSPSALNTQPWEITIVAGDILDRIREANVEMLASGVASKTDIMHGNFEGIYKQRQVDTAVQIFQLMGIAREDKEKRAEWTQKGFRFFDAPAAIILSTESSLEESRTQFDLGLLTQTICLAALNYGLGTCIERQGIMYADVVRRFTGIPESQRISVAIAIGYPDADFPANKLETKRESVENITTWFGFD